VTFSGGEPMMQHSFLCEVCDRLHNINKAIQTSGYAEPDVYRHVIERFDYIMQDIKLADPAEHMRYTGVSNEKILCNIEALKNSGKEFIFRIPLIPNITDTEENLTKISKIVGDHPVELLRYNDLAGAKYDMLGMSYDLSTLSGKNTDYTRFFANAIQK